MWLRSTKCGRWVCLTRAYRHPLLKYADWRNCVIPLALFRKVAIQRKCRTRRFGRCGNTSVVRHFINPKLLETKLKFFHYILSTVILIFCGLIFITHTWSFVATVDQRPGLNGNMHLHYQLSRFEFAAYDFLIATLTLLISLPVLLSTLQSNKQKLKKSFIRFLYFIAFLIICEVYLNTRFIGKGWNFLFVAYYTLHLMLNAIAVVLCFIAMLLFFSKVLLYFKLKKPEKSIFWSLVTGQFIYYFAICLLPVFAATNFNQKTQRTLNILTYLFYFLIILGFLFGYFGYKLQEQ